jgi:hypothetical protein
MSETGEPIKVTLVTTVAQGCVSDLCMSVRVCADSCRACSYKWTKTKNRHVHSQ